MVVLLQIFLSERPAQPFPSGRLSYTDAYIRFYKEKIESQGLNPITRDDLFGVLVNRFAPDRFDCIIEYAKRILKMSRHEIDDLVRDVAFSCLEIGCKGRMLEKLLDMYPKLGDAIRDRVMKQYMFQVDDLPAPENERECFTYEATLCRDFIMPRHTGASGFEHLLLDELSGQMQVAPPQPPMIQGAPDGDVDMVGVEDGDRTAQASDDEFEDIVRPSLSNSPPPLKWILTKQLQDYISQDTLSTMIRKDETRGRRRFYDYLSTYNDTAGKLTYPPDYMPVGKVIRNLYGVRSGVAAVFMLHAVANGNPMVCCYLFL